MSWESPDRSNRTGEESASAGSSLSGVSECHSRSGALWGLFTLALLGALYMARTVVLPVVLAVLVSLLLAPVVRVLERLKVPRWLGAALLVAGLVAAVGGGIYSLAGPASDWLSRAPTTLRRAEAKLKRIKAPVEKVSRATEQMERMADVDGSKTQQVEVAKPSLSGNLMNLTLSVAGAVAVSLILLYFLLASGDRFVRKAANLLPGAGSKHRSVLLAKRLERSISTYLLTITLINTVLGLAVGGLLWLLDMPSPMLWGAMAGLLNFIPYLGAMVGVVIVSLISFLTFDSMTAMLAPPAIYFALTSIEGSFITPMILGRSLRMNPLVIFVAIIFWGWMWGVAGALLAVPLVATAKIVCDHVESLRPIGVLLER